MRWLQFCDNVRIGQILDLHSSNSINVKAHGLYVPSSMPKIMNEIERKTVCKRTQEEHGCHNQHARC